MALPPPPVTTYRQYYDEPTNNPYLDYTDIYTPFRVDPANVVASPTPGNVATAFYTASTAGDPNAFLLLHPNDPTTPETGPGHIACYHGLGQFPQRLGVPPTQWDTRAFAFHGDFIHNSIQTIEWPTQSFHLANAIRVTSAVAIDQFFANDANATALGPFAAGDADTEIVRVRFGIYIPPPLIAIILTDPLSPRQAWERIRGEIVRLGIEIQCGPLIDWLRCAVTRNLGVGHTISLIQRPVPIVPLANATLINHRHNRIMQNLPARNTPIPTGADAMLINRGLGELTETIRQGQVVDQARVDAKANKTVEDYFRSETLNLCNICNVDNQEHLPPIYQALARAANKREERRILQSHLDQERIHVNRHLVITATTELYTMVSMLQFRMTDIDNLSTPGFHPFMFCQHNPRDEEKALQSATLHDALYSDNARATVSELTAMLKGSPADSSLLPPSHMHGINMISKQQVLARVLLGPTHPLVLAHQQFISTWQVVATEMQARTAVTQGHTGTHLPAMVVRYFQIKLAVWMKRQWDSNAIIPIPYFNELFDKEAECDYMGWEK